MNRRWIRDKLHEWAKAPATVERDPDRRPAMDTLDDWILFGPRMR